MGQIRIFLSYIILTRELTIVNFKISVMGKKERDWRVKGQIRDI